MTDHNIKPISTEKLVAYFDADHCVPDVDQEIDDKFMVQFLNEDVDHGAREIARCIYQAHLLASTSGIPGGCACPLCVTTHAFITGFYAGYKFAQIELLERQHSNDGAS